MYWPCKRTTFRIKCVCKLYSLKEKNIWFEHVCPPWPSNSNCSWLSVRWSRGSNRPHHECVTFTGNTMTLPFYTAIPESQNPSHRQEIQCLCTCRITNQRMRLHMFICMQEVKPRKPEKWLKKQMVNIIKMTLIFCLKQEQSFREWQGRLIPWCRNLHSEFHHKVFD